MSVLLVVLFTCFFTSAVLVDAAALKKGMSGSEVETLQSNLKKLGYFEDSVTGFFGTVTENAVKKFQEEHRLTVDGIAGDETLAYIDKLLNPTITAGIVLKKGMSGDDVAALQNALKVLGFFNDEVTGYFGDVTEEAVRSFQASCNIEADGVVGTQTMLALERTAAVKVSRGTEASYLLAWSDVDKIFTIGTRATVYDIDSGLSFQVVRSYGDYHADCEPLTAEDTSNLKKIYGGEWSWNRRAVIIDVNGFKIAASIIGMPHAGREDQPEGKYVSSRSGGYGYGYNFDSVKGNNMNGHICIHFYKSRTHNANRQDSDHQAMVKKAAQWARDNYR